MPHGSPTATYLAEKVKKFKFSFTGKGAGAGIPEHLHFYGFTGALPIERAHTIAPILMLDDLIVQELDKDWPVITLVLTGDHARITHYLRNLTIHLEDQGIGVNILFTRDENSKARVYVVPRSQSKPDLQTGFDKDFGVVEMSGMIVCESDRLFQSSDPGMVVDAMRQVGYPNTEAGRARLLYSLFP